MIRSFDTSLDVGQLAEISRLGSPAQIQAFLDELPYSAEDANRCPLRVLQDRQAHCLDGALFAAAVLCRLGYPSVIVDLVPDPGTDDDHVLAIYRRGGRYGAVAKSNFVGLRFREAVYRSLRELSMSYFEVFYNVNGLKTLRSYSLPLYLDRLAVPWRDSDAAIDVVVQRLDARHRISLVSASLVEALSPVDRLSYQAGMLGANPAGLYKPIS